MTCHLIKDLLDFKQRCFGLLYPLSIAKIIAKINSWRIMKFALYNDKKVLLHSKLTPEPKISRS